MQLKERSVPSTCRLCTCCSSSSSTPTKDPVHIADLPPPPQRSRHPGMFMVIEKASSPDWLPHLGMFTPGASYYSHSADMMVVWRCSVLQRHKQGGVAGVQAASAF